MTFGTIFPSKHYKYDSWDNISLKTLQIKLREGLVIPQGQHNAQHKESQHKEVESIENPQERPGDPKSN